ncbi:MAG: hypothetical protein K8T25_08980 [Planctomycetia bacterium]|nr:hypothetical protein [Planctomycetia bacterium]
MRLSLRGPLRVVLICTGLVAAVLAAPTAALAQLKIGSATALDFATVDEGRALLTAHDDYVERLTPFDRGARLKTDRDVPEAEFLRFAGENVLGWEPADRQTLSAAINDVLPRLAALNVPLPKRVLLVQTTGNEEANAAYTRANAVFLPKSNLHERPAELQKKLSHELFHVLSRANPELRDKLYAAIGFVKCNEPPLPPELAARKISNPDAPRNDHCIRLKVAGRDQWAIPIIFSRTPKYDMRRGGDFFQYLQFAFLLVDRDEKTGTVKLAGDGQRPQLIGLREAGGFLDQVGMNTGYIIHPEEILADNFALLVMHEPNVPSPEILKKIGAILKEK